MLTPCRGVADLEGSQVKAGPGENVWAPRRTGVGEAVGAGPWGRGPRARSEFTAQVPGLWLLEKTGAKGARASGENWPVGAWAQSWSSAALAARSVLPSNRPATPLFSPACWEPGFQAWVC